MLHRTFKLGLVAATALAAALPLLASPAYADYAPAKNDVVGVGSDVLQYMIDFLANGDAYGDSGFGASNPHYLLVNIDATADANGRLAYGVSGGAAQGTVVGTGATFASGACRGEHQQQVDQLHPHNFIHNPAWHQHSGAP